MLLVAIGLLFVVSIPWYRDPGAQPAFWFGLPEWVAVAILCYIAVACLNAAAWSLTDISDSSDEGDDA